MWSVVARRVFVTLFILAAGCSGPEVADPTPPQLRFDLGADADGSGINGDEVLNRDQLRSELDALRDSNSTLHRLLSRLAAGEPPISGPIEVATAIESEVIAYSSRSLSQAIGLFPNPTQFGGTRVFRTLDSSSHPDAVQVSLPVMPNGQTGWIPRESIELSTISHQILINLDEDLVTVWDGDEVIVHSPAVTGTPWTPTPAGIFYLRDVIPQADPNGVYGTNILALSGFSEVLDSFGGGLPAIAIHGTNRPDTMGEERSNGCVRLPNDLIDLLADDLPLGTPVTIIDSTRSLGFGQVADRFGGRRIF